MSRVVSRTDVSVPNRDPPSVSGSSSSSPSSVSPALTLRSRRAHYWSQCCLHGPAPYSDIRLFVQQQGLQANRVVSGGKKTIMSQI